MTSGKGHGGASARGPRDDRRRGGHWLAVAMALLAPLPALAAAPAPAVPATFVMATDLDETTPYGKWYRRIYAEAFRRMGVPLKVETLPTARVTVSADQGEVHGQGSRVFAYADSHPNQLRVDEVLHEVRLVLFAFGPANRPDQPRRIEDLAGGKWLVEYRRGVAICEQKLKPLVAAERLSDVTTIDQGLKKLKAGRTDFYCDFDTGVQNELLMPAFKGEAGYRNALDLGVGIPLYPYVHKSRAELAPRLAETLRRMKAEGLIERYRREAEQEAGAAR
jgi:hypothetical protein